jgi:hypothetical protein
LGRLRGPAAIAVVRSVGLLWWPQAWQGVWVVRWFRVARRTTVKEISSGSMPRLMAVVTAWLTRVL